MPAAGTAPEPAGPPDQARRYAKLGIVASSASRESLLRALQRLQRHDVRLQRISDSAGIETLYRVEVAISGLRGPRAGREAWSAIKHALIAAFPHGRPGAVTAIDP